MAVFQDIVAPERGVILLDAKLRITHANRRAGEMLGSAVQEMIGGELPESLRRPSDDLEIVEEVIESASGEPRAFHRYSAPVCGANGLPAGRVEIYSDITARRELEKEILERNTELAELNRRLQEAQDQLIRSERLRALGEMAAGVAHDINNVLGIILGNVQLARGRPDADTAKSLEAIDLAARDAAETVRRLREMGKPADTSHYRAVDLGEIVQDVVRTAVPAWQDDDGGHVGVRTDLAPACTVYGDPVELREALANILLNARQASSDGGAIEIATKRGAGQAELVVKDTGVGMSEETRKRVFDPFFTTRGAEGTGLGMSMVDAIAIRHGGRVTVESREGVGTTVTLKLPLYRKGNE